MKIVGIVCLVCTCAAAGITAALRLRRVHRLWEAWVTLLQRLYRDLRYSAMPLQSLLGTVDKEGLTALEWLSEFEDGAELHCPQSVRAEEKPFADSFFSGLGATDLQGQLHHIEWHLQKAQEEAMRADEQYAERAKAYTTTGICAGLCVGFLLW